jgi:hypothetical protein
VKSIGEFFARIRNKHLDEMRLRLTVQEIIEKHAKTKPSPDSISFSTRSVSVKGLSQAAKSVIFVKKTAILKELNDNFPGRSIENINLS